MSCILEEWMTSFYSPYGVYCLDIALICGQIVINFSPKWSMTVEFHTSECAVI